MYYIWGFSKENTRKNLFACGLKEFDGWLNLYWQGGEKFFYNLPEPLVFISDYKTEPHDYPFNVSTVFLVSKKIRDVFLKTNVKNVDVYEAMIYLDKVKKHIKNYYAVNIIGVVDCIDYEKSEVIVKQYGPNEKTEYFNKLVIDEKKIPTDLKLFRMYNRKSLIIVHDSVVSECEKDNVVGVDFIPVGEYCDIF